jgi:DNA repair exonuclease SbcCD nuclease subunit
MIKKLVHFSDLHLRLFKDHDLYRRILTDMFEQFKEIKPDRVVFTGDLLHSKNNLTPELIEIASWVLTECSKIAKTIIIPGNHDFITNLERLDSLTPIITSLNNTNIVYYKDRGIYEDENVSWCVYSQFQGNIPPEISEAKGVKIGLFHGPISGLKTDLGYDFGDHAYDVNKFGGLDVVLCGDIHKRSIFSIPGGKKGMMIGSTIAQNYGECLTGHGYGILDVETMDYTTHDLYNPKPFLSFKITSYDDILNDEEVLTNG